VEKEGDGLLRKIMNTSAFILFSSQRDEDKDALEKRRPFTGKKAATTM
jgi:hypothetical protein